MTMLFELLFYNISFYIDPLLKYDEDGYLIEENEYNEEYTEEGDLDNLYDDLESVENSELK